MLTPCYMIHVLHGILPNSTSTILIFFYYKLHMCLKLFHRNVLSPKSPLFVLTTFITQKVSIAFQNLQVSTILSWVGAMAMVYFSTSTICGPFTNHLYIYFIICRYLKEEGCLLDLLLVMEIFHLLALHSKPYYLPPPFLPYFFFIYVFPQR